MQMLATLKIEGTLTGSITQTYDVDFYVEGFAAYNQVSRVWSSDSENSSFLARNGRDQHWHDRGV